VSATDPATFLGVALVSMRLSARVDPMVALRYE